MSENWIVVASVADIAPGEMKGAQVGGAQIAIYNVDGNYFATSNICTHAFTYLTDGWLEDHLIECPLHAGQFDVRTGKGQGAPITCDLEVYQVRVSGGQIEVCVRLVC